VSIFGKRSEPSKDDISARLNQAVGRTFPPPPPAPEEEPEQAVLQQPPAPPPATSEALSAPAAVAAPVETPGPSAAPSPAAVTPQAAAAVPRVEAPVAFPAAPPPPQESAPAAPAGAGATSQQPAFFPTRPESIEETGLQRPFLTDLVLRILYQANEIMGSTLAERTAIPFIGVLSPILESLRHDQEIEVKGQRGVGDAGYVYGITEKGARHARDSMDRIAYTGPAPVPFEEYTRSVLAQTVRNVVVTQENIREAFNDLIIEDSILDVVGPAVNSGSSMFLFGYPGNGKTSIAERITKLMGDYIFVPYGVEVEGSIITVFDAINHTPYEEKGTNGQPTRSSWDARWVRIERPIVMVGGELTMSSLDLLYNDIGKYYEAPLQMKANGGMFLIDDFGRQMIRPQDLLNRWIVPLEKRIDFLNLVTGKKLSVPFEQLIVFSTNLDPKDLVDDAFLRRIKFKINVLDPSEDQFRAIFQFMCRRRDVPFDEEMFQYMLDAFYRPTGRPLRMCQPRDIIDQIIAIAKYKMVPATLSKPLMDRACETYFVSVSG
jgi:hypothetical protein